MKNSLDRSISYRMKIFSKTTLAFITRRSKEKSEIWASVCGCDSYETMKMEVSEQLDANKDKFNNFFPAEKKMNSSSYEYVLPHEFFEEFLKHPKDT